MNDLHITGQCFVGFFIAILLGINNLTLGQENNKLTINGTHQNEIKDSIEKRITEIIYSINNHNQWQDFSITGNNPAIGILNQLVDEHHIFSVRSAKHLYLLNRPDQTLEVRNLYVKSTQITTLEHNELMLHFNREGQLINAKLLPDKQNHQLILDRQINVSYTIENKIQQFVWNYQQELAHEESTQLDKVIEKDARIVSSFISQYHTPNTYDFKYLSMNKEEYLQRLNQNIFHKYDDIHISNSNIEVYRHPLFNDVFAAVFQQEWNTNTYSDNGYVVMIIDAEPKPRLLLRTWKRFKPETGNLKIEPSYITDISNHQAADLNNMETQLEKFTIDTGSESPKPGFFKTNKRWLIISTATATAVGLGLSLLLNDGATELPGPPGRPTAN